MDFFDLIRRQFGVPNAVRTENRKQAVAAKVAQQAGIDLPRTVDERARRVAAIGLVIDQVVAAADEGLLDPQFAEYDAEDNVAADIARQAPRDLLDQLGVEKTRETADYLIASLVKYVRKHPFEDFERS